MLASADAAIQTSLFLCVPHVQHVQTVNRAPLIPHDFTHSIRLVLNALPRKFSPSRSLPEFVLNQNSQALTR